MLVQLLAALSITASPIMAVHSLRVRAHDDSLMINVTVDSARRQIVVTAGPFPLPAMPAGMRHEHGYGSPVLRFVSPVAGWIRGYRITLEDSSGAPLPRAVIHHIGVADFERRELAYPMVERIFAAGKETPEVKLPAAIGVPIALGEQLGLYEGFHNETGRDLPAAYVRVAILWTPTHGHKPLGVLPFYAEVKNDVGGHSWYDIPPGRSTRRAGFDWKMPRRGRCSCD
ncbi:MAG TPA: hypothetical protein VIM15_12580 [Gemmatimonadaceae bacterium]